VNPLERTVRAIDRAQQKNRILGFVFGVNKKYGDDRGGQLAALLAYYGFLSLFPLLLLLVTVLGMVAGSDPSLAHRIEHSAFSQFPVIGSGSDKQGSSLAASITAVHRNSAIGLVVGVLGLIWGSQGASQIGQFAMAEVWNVPGVHRPNFWSRLARTGVLMAVLGVFLILSSSLAAVATWGHRALILRVGGVAGALVVNAVLYLLAFRVLTPKQIGNRGLVPGALIGATAWTILQNVGTALIEHQLRNASQVYGTFAVVLGLLAWIYLGANITMYAAEANVVWARRLWPRSLVQPPLTAADREVLAAIVKQGQRRPEQRVSVRFDAGEDDTPSPPASS
jgi:YihY family inner membrane protein